MHEFQARGDAMVEREQISPSTTNRGRRGRFTCLNIVGWVKAGTFGTCWYLWRDRSRRRW